MDKKKCTCIKLLHAPTDRSNLYHLKLLNKFCSAGMGKQTQFEMQQKEEDKAEKFNDYVAFTILNKTLLLTYLRYVRSKSIPEV